MDEPMLLVRGFGRFQPVSRASPPALRCPSLVSNMSSTVPALKIWSAQEVKEWIQREEHSSWVVVDVRDHDFAGGHIKGCINQPAANFEDDTDVDKFIDQQLTPDVKTVIVHCALSQVRGPSCANRLRNRLASKEQEQAPQIVVMSKGFLGAAKVMADGEQNLVCACEDGSCRCAQK